MKIKLSRTQWELVGKKAGWMKKAGLDDSKNFDYSDPKNYAPGQTPYSKDEWDVVRKLVSDSADANETGEFGELEEPDDNVSRNRVVKVIFDNGDSLRTSINGTVPEIRKYYMESGPQDYDMAHPEKLRRPVKVEFLS